MTTVGFIGLGVMGKPMARQVLAAGHEVIVHNRSPQAVDESAPCLHVRSASATSQRGCRRCSAQGFFEAARTI